MIRFNHTAFADAWLIEPERVLDERGFFARTFCIRDFSERGLENGFVQHATSRSNRKGTLRGMHFQKEPYSEVKVVACLRGAIHDVIVDLRPDSATYLKWAAFELTSENLRRLYIPKGFAHGFQALTENAEVGYLLSAFYEPAAASGVRYNDPRIGIEWPLPVSVISEKDRNWSLLEE